MKIRVQKVSHTLRNLSICILILDIIITVIDILAEDYVGLFVVVSITVLWVITNIKGSQNLKSKVLIIGAVYGFMVGLTMTILAIIFLTASELFDTLVLVLLST